MALPGTETIRFRRPTTGPNAPAQKSEAKKDEFGSMAPLGWKRRHQGLLQDKLSRWVGREGGGSERARHDFRSTANPLNGEAAC
jgi:hypothetical protein